MAVAETIDDNRRCCRFESGAVLSYFPFTSRKVPALAAHVIDCGREGLGFRSSRSLKPGQTICLLARPGEGEVGAQCRSAELLKSFAVAEVRWCRQAAGQEDAYLIGVRYL